MSEFTDAQAKQSSRAAEQYFAEPEPEVSQLEAIIEATERNPSLADFSPSKLEAACSFDLSTERGKQLYWEACNGEHMDLIDAAGMCLAVVDWIAMRKTVQRSRERPEEQGMVCCLFLEDGATVSWASPTTNQQWSNVVRVCGKGPYYPPLKIVLQANKSADKQKRDWYSVLPWKE